MISLLAGAWGCLAGVPCVVLARRLWAGERLRGLAPRPAPRRARVVAVSRWFTALAPIGTIGRVFRAPARSRRRRRLDDEMARQIAVAVDLVGVAVAAGHTPYLAAQLGARWSPPLVAHELDAAVGACAMGQSFDDALREMARRSPGTRGLAEALRTSARLGAPAAPALARLATELRADLRRRAETRARTVPVRLCFPLVGCILPAFALLTVVPAVVAGISR